MLSAGKINSLLSEPQTVSQLLAACQDPATTPGQLREIVLQDGVLCAKIIDAAARVCPDSLDAAAPVTSALAGLTLPIVKSIALQSAKNLTVSRFDAEQAHFLRHLWFFARAAGRIALATAEAVAYPAPEEAQVTAMLTNVGMLALFAHDPEKYMRNIVSPFSNKEVRNRERLAFKVNHLQLAYTLVSGWGEDSFMAEAIRFVHLDPEYSRESSALVRINQLSQELCRSPLSLETAVSKAEQLFGLQEEETVPLFRRAEEQYLACNPLDHHPDESLQELTKAGQRLTAFLFSLFEQETVRSHLSAAAPPGDPLSSARQLYLHHLPEALEAVFFLFDRSTCRLVGLPSAQQSRLVAELVTPLTAVNLLAVAVNGGQRLHSFDAGAELTVFDRQLIRVCKGSGIACLPLWLEDRPVGGVVFGLESPGDVESLESPSLGFLNQTLACTLATLGNDTAAAERKPEGRQIDLIPRLAHEIGNPLAIINNYMDVLSMFLKGSENEEFLTAVVKQVERIDEILTYYSSGADADTPKLSNSVIDFNAEVASVVESLRPALFVPKKIEVNTDFDTGLRTVSTNPVAIKQILVNLLTNATEAVADDGRIAIKTREQVRSDGQHYVTIVVEDNGPGVDRQVMGGLFSPVISTKGGSHAGIGLSIAKGMADDIGATLSCHSTPTSGTSFSLTLPQAG